MEISSGAKRRFVKDSGIPIHIFKEPYFTYLIDVYDEFYDTKSKYEQFISLLEELGGEEAFFSESQRIIDNIINDVISKPVYQDIFNGKSFSFGTKNKYQQKNVYSSDFHGKLVLSIDIKQANFQSIQYIDKTIFDNASNFDEFISRYTSHQYFIKSKQLRQVIFGNLNPKRQKSIQTHMMLSFLEYLVSQLYISLDKVVLVSPDEAAITFDSVSKSDLDRSEARTFFMSVLAALDQFRLDNGNKLWANVQMFDLFRLNPHDFFVKIIQFFDSFHHEVMLDEEVSSIQIKHTPGYFIPQIIKYIYNMPVSEMDLAFFYENQVCRFMHPLKFDNLSFAELKGAIRCR